MRETRILQLGGDIVFAAFAPRGERLLVASSKGRIGLYHRSGRPMAQLPRQPQLTEAAWSPDGRLFATGSFDGEAIIWQVGRNTPLRTIATTASHHVSPAEIYSSPETQGITIMLCGRPSAIAVSLACSFQVNGRISIGPSLVLEIRLGEGSSRSRQHAYA
jgi:WD40 repeat protein